MNFFFCLLLLIGFSGIYAGTKHIEIGLYKDFNKQNPITIQKDTLIKSTFYFDIDHTYGDDFNVIIDRAQGIDSHGEYHEIKFKYHPESKVYSANNRFRYNYIVLSGYIYKYDSHDDEIIFHKEVELNYKEPEHVMLPSIIGITTGIWAIISKFISSKLKRN